MSPSPRGDDDAPSSSGTRAARRRSSRRAPRAPRARRTSSQRRVAATSGSFDPGRRSTSPTWIAAGGAGGLLLLVIAALLFLGGEGSSEDRGSSPQATPAEISTATAETEERSDDPPAIEETVPTAEEPTEPTPVAFPLAESAGAAESADPRAGPGAAGATPTSLPPEPPPGPPRAEAPTAQAPAPLDGRPPPELVRLVAKAEAQYARRDFRGAVATLGEAIRLFPGVAELLLRRAGVRRTAGDPNGALTDLDAAVALEPSNADVRLFRAQIRAEQGDPEGAGDDAIAALKAYSDDYALHCRTADWLHGIGAFRHGVIAYGRVIELRPTGKQYMNRGVCRGKAGDRRGALEDYDEAIRRSPRLPMAWINRAKTKRHLGLPEEALLDAVQARTLLPDWVDAHVVEGKILCDLGRWRESETVFSRVLERMSPGRHETSSCFFRGRALAALDDLEQAERWLGRAIEISTARPDLWSHFFRGDVRIRRDDLAGARADFETALRAFPDYGRARAGLARVLLGEGRTDEAFAELERAAADAPDDAYVFFRRGEARAREKRPGADADFARSIELEAVEPTPIWRDWHAKVVALRERAGR